MAIAQEMARDDAVVFLGEDVAAAGGVFKATVGLLERFGPRRVVDTPISEQAILGAAMGAAMTGLRPIAEIMFSDFLGRLLGHDRQQIAKTRYMTGRQVALPLVIRTGNGGGLRFGAQHSQSVENWAMAVPGVKVVAPSTAEDVIGLLAAAVRDPDPVLFFEHKALYPTKGEVPDGEIVDTLGTAKVRRRGSDCTILALGCDGAAGARRRRRTRRGWASRRPSSTSARWSRSTPQTILARVRRDRTAVHRRGEPAPAGLGRRDRVDHRRGVLLGPRRPDRPDHHAAHPAARRRHARGPRHPLG